VRFALASSLALLVTTTAACGWLSSEPPLFTVGELVPRIDELNGKRLRVAGYLGDCAVYSCDLYPSKEDVAVWNRAFAELRTTRHFNDPKLPVLGIGTGKAEERGFEFDRKAAPFHQRYVVITGTVDNRCRYKGERGCTDRSPDLNPTDISLWTGPVPPRPASPGRKA